MHLANETVNLIGFGMGITRIVGPVMLLWCAFDIGGKVNEILFAGILDIKESFLPFAA